MQVLRTQNSKLRQALVRLRDNGFVEKTEMEKKLLQLEKNDKNTQHLSDKCNALVVENSSMKETIALLKDQVDDAQAFEYLVEDMTDKNLELNDQVVELKGTVSCTHTLKAAQCRYLRNSLVDLQCSSVVFFIFLFHFN